jgi:hypothetical protein
MEWHHDDVQGPAFWRDRMAFCRECADSGCPVSKFVALHGKAVLTRFAAAVQSKCEFVQEFEAAEPVIRERCKLRGTP